MFNFIIFILSKNCIVLVIVLNVYVLLKKNSMKNLKFKIKKKCKNKNIVLKYCIL